MYLTREEKETVIVFNEADETATVYTCRKGWINALQKVNAELIREYSSGFMKFSVPKNWVRLKINTDEFKKLLKG